MLRRGGSAERGNSYSEILSLHTLTVSLSGFQESVRSSKSSSSSSSMKLKIIPKVKKEKEKLHKQKSNSSLSGKKIIKDSLCRCAEGGSKHDLKVTFLSHACQLSGSVIVEMSFCDS